MAEPLVKKIRAPKRSSINIIGRSQNFFLTFKYAQKSFKKFKMSSLLKREIYVFFSEKMVPVDEQRILLVLQKERIFVSQSKKKSNRSKQQYINDREDYPRYYRTHKLRQAEP